MKLVQKMRSRMAVNIIGAIVMLLVVFGLIVSAIGYVNFTDAFKREYSVTTYHMADTAAALVNGDHIDAYLQGERAEEYRQTKARIDTYCTRMNVSLVYVIRVDTGDYGRFVSVFNSVNNTVDNSAYTEWELGHARNTTNDEYREVYRSLYEADAPYGTVYRIRPGDGSHPHITTLVPVKDSGGKTTALLCVQRPMRELRDAQRPYLIHIALSTVALAILASAIAVAYIRTKILRPIQSASDEATRFAKENTKGEPIGTISRYEELQNLTRAIDTMETDMVRYMENLTAATAEKERIVAELSLANTIQMNSIPNDFPAFPDRTEFDIYASMDPAKDVGGDFYNFFPIDEDHLAIVIGDVSGKGIPAALFMMVTNILISDRTRMGGSPAEILAYVNDDLCKHNKADMFVTVWLGILELSTGKLVAANAGHEYPILAQNGTFALLQDKHGFVVGGMDGMRYRNYELTLAPGDKLFLYTDGLPEATDADERMFGTERVLAALNGAKDASAQEILQAVHAAVNDFVKDAEQFDDLTMLCLDYRGTTGENTYGTTA